MTKFIEVTDTYQDMKMRLINANDIREVRVLRGHHPAKAWIMFGREEIYCTESYEEIKAMLMYDPAVADIVIGGSHD